MRPLFSFRAVNFIIIIKPRLSIPTGLFHTEYTSYLPLSYIYYLSGLRGVRMPKTRSVALALLHAHVVAPAVAVVVCAGFQGLDHRIVRGALMSSTGGPCGWVSLSVCRSAHAPALIAASYGAALLAAPLAMIILCGRATVPPLGGILSTLLTTLTPFMLGTLMRTTEIAINSETTTKSPIARSSDCTTKSTKLWRELTTKYRVSTIKWREVTTKCCMLLLLYCECCARLRDAAGVLYVGDVLATLALVVCMVSANALSCLAAARGAGGAGMRWAALAACSIPKCFDAGWESSTTCTPSGLSRLPAVFLPPAQALLLAAIYTQDVCDEDREDDDTMMTVQSLPQ
ncbi:uncharacterized protein LOC113225725 isoform X1 [Hyposmocoma kahamanoa]|uniref:uncharacterized protein LOC113225725 isoform X1 n=1 Tax=Hyposmocoma kahamanoa TaxID=1477025 RepID=UPI000E6D6343|nr:uncharacterized protein LOC113225725 isoform X1 [Hyposmocoma kahamanoa]